MRSRKFHLPASKPLKVMVVAATVAGLAVVGVATKSSLLSSTAMATQPVKVVQSVPVPAMPVNIADVIEKVSPAVVTIKTSSSAPESEYSQNTVPPQLEEFFKRFFGPNAPWQFNNPSQGPSQGPQNQSPPPQRHLRGLGSGFIIEKDGLIVTNYHVIKGADQITVMLDNKREYPAKIIGQDDKTDIALLKIDAGNNLPTVKFGNSDTMRVGDWVITVGNPFGIGKTATVGVISARHRDIGSGPFDDFLQIDAPINRGNSGGPTLNLNGEVIGINAAIFTPSGGNVGIGFAIPSSLAKEIVTDLKANGKVERGWLGVHIQGVTPEIADSLGLDKPKGALVAQVNENSPASHGGIQQGDVILAVNGTDVTQLRDLPRLIGKLTAGDQAKIALWRDGHEKNVTVTIGRTPSQNEVIASAKPGTVDGLGLAALDEANRHAYGIGDDVTGVVITGVDPNSQAALHGLSRGDVIVSVGGKNVSSPSEVKGAFQRAEKSKARAVLLLVQRQSEERFVALPLRDA